MWPPSFSLFLRSTRSSLTFSFYILSFKILFSEDGSSGSSTRYITLLNYMYLTLWKYYYVKSYGNINIFKWIYIYLGIERHWLINTRSNIHKSNGLILINSDFQLKCICSWARYLTFHLYNWDNKIHLSGCCEN